mmetsp:Transcript_16914/g.30388  ORF Transcript_16914/g.30388 Transcript_16914/m.30388 type:complete len:286 (-) Transcript_16914:635-1492(-)
MFLRRQRYIHNLLRSSRFPLNWLVDGCNSGTLFLLRPSRFPLLRYQNFLWLLANFCLTHRCSFRLWLCHISNRLFLHKFMVLLKLHHPSGTIRFLAFHVSHNFFEATLDLLLGLCQFLFLFNFFLNFLGQFAKASTFSLFKFDEFCFRDKAVGLSSVFEFYSIPEYKAGHVTSIILSIIKHLQPHVPHWPRLHIKRTQFQHRQPILPPPRKRPLAEPRLNALGNTTQYIFLVLFKVGLGRYFVNGRNILCSPRLLAAMIIGDIHGFIPCSVAADVGCIRHFVVRE